MKFNHIKNTLAIVLILFLSLNVYGTALANDSVYYLSDDQTAKSVKNNKGFADGMDIGKDDPHYGWVLGKFYVTGFTYKEKVGGDPVTIYKNVGDKVVLHFKLSQDIDKLNNDGRLTIAYDKKGYDEEFQKSETAFKRGALFVKYTDSENASQKPKAYYDYLTGVSNGVADTEIELNEEGDYEVALDYKIKKTISTTKIIKSIAPTYTSYTMRFKFNLRNSNSMVFPIDLATGNELQSGAYAEKGFKIDLANSKYLKVNIKKLQLSKSQDDWIEDVRYNRLAKDGEIFTEEGKYIVTVTNPSTNELTTKEIYVGSNDIIKASASNDMSLKEIKQATENGAKISNTGEIIYKTDIDTTTKAPTTSRQEQKIGSASIVVIIVLIILIVLLLIFAILTIRRNKLNNVKLIENQEIKQGTQEVQEVQGVLEVQENENEDKDECIGI